MTIEEELNTLPHRIQNMMISNPPPPNHYQQPYLSSQPLVRDVKYQPKFEELYQLKNEIADRLNPVNIQEEQWQRELREVHRKLGGIKEPKRDNANEEECADIYSQCDLQIVHSKYTEYKETNGNRRTRISIPDILNHDNVPPPNPNTVEGISVRRYTEKFNQSVNPGTPESQNVLGYLQGLNMCIQLQIWNPFTENTVENLQETAISIDEGYLQYCN